MTRDAKRIAILLPDLRGGGVERMRIYLAREFIAQGHEVEFVLMRASGDLLSAIPRTANVIDLGANRIMAALRPLMNYVRERQPEVLLVAMWPLTVVAVIAARLSGTSVRTVLSDHSILSQSYQHKGVLHRALLRISMALGYRLADARVAVSEGVANDVSALSGICKSRFKVIYNPAASGVDATANVPVPPELANVHGPLILSVGTFKPVKDYPLLIDAFSRLALHLEATLCILGEGEQRVELEQLVVRHSLQGRVLLPGFRAYTAPYYARADLFVMSSRHEGFGNVIVEALEHGVPVVSTDCPSGPREILCDGNFGYLVPVGDAQALAAAMAESLVSQHDYGALRARAQDFCIDKAVDQYKAVLFPDLKSKADM